MPCSRTFAATTRMISELAIMPVLTASTPMSVTTASIWAATISGGISWTAVTPRVFWAVIAVSADMPNTPERRERLQVGLDAGPAARVRARDRQRRPHPVHAAS